jgi:hypothetical protein
MRPVGGRGPGHATAVAGRARSVVMTMPDSRTPDSGSPVPVSGPTPPGWYRMPGVPDKARYWDGRTLAPHAEWIPRGVELPLVTDDMRTDDPKPSAPGWYRDPRIPHARRYWDGQGWVGYAEPLAEGDVCLDVPDPRSPVPRSSFLALAALTTAGIATVAANVVLSPYCVARYPGFDCDAVILSSPAMWLTWLVLVGLAVGATVLLARTAGRKGDGRLLIMAGVGLAWLAVAVLFPPAMVFVTLMSAAM